MCRLSAFVSTVSCSIMGTVFTQVEASIAIVEVNLPLLDAYANPPHRVSQKPLQLLHLLLVPFVLIHN